MQKKAHTTVHSHPHGHDHATHGHDSATESPPRARHIYVYSPSGAVRDKAAFRRGVRRLEALGHSVEVDVDALASHLRFAGDDDTRLAAISRAASSGADVALISRGGYGITRILPRIDYRAIAKATTQGTRFVGLSDFTALQNAVLAKKKTITWAGPALCADFGVADTPDEIMEACFDDLLLGQGEGAGWRLPLEKAGATSKIAESAIRKSAKADFHIKKAMLWGGNLAVLTSLLATPWFPDVKGGILFLEDVNEHPFRIERLLTQLLHAGVLGRQKAVVLGQFTDFKVSAHDRGFKLQTVVDWLRANTRTPVFMGLPFGHVATKVLLPVGADVSLTVEGRDALIYWGHV
jgi:muramoyltetrapeptide carboxypeptidase